VKKFLFILKKIVTLLAITGSIVLFVVVLSSAIQKDATAICPGVEVNIDHHTGITFITKKEVLSVIKFANGRKAEGSVVSEMSLQTMENALLKLPHVATAQVYFDIQHRLHATITQRRPIMRILNNDGVGYYVGINNERIPLKSTFTAHVPVVTGFVLKNQDPKRDSSLQNALFLLVNVLQKDPYLNALIHQIDVLENDEVVLIPNGLKHSIQFGKADERIEAKLENIKAIHLHGLPHVGWDLYKSINVKYDNQVVCEKNTDKVLTVPSDTTTTNKL